MREKPTEKQHDTTSNTSETDWDRLERMSDEDIDTSDIPEPTPEQFARAVAREGLQSRPPKQQVSLRIDADVIQWFKEGGKGYQRRINVLVRAYAGAHQG